MVFSRRTTPSKKHSICYSLASAGFISWMYSKILLNAACSGTSFNACKRNSPLVLRHISHCSHRRLACTHRGHTAFMPYSDAFGYVLGQRFANIANTNTLRNYHTMATRANENLPSSAFLPAWARDVLKVEHSDFTKHRSEYIPDLGIAANIYKHNDLGLQVVVLTTDKSLGKEMCYDIVVPSLPSNDKGCPHVLEHSVLAGCNKYPFKTAFIVAIQGGFHSFFNAFTYKDRTSYLFASTNEKDFFNTAEFYTDSFFRPLIRNQEDVFRREGWHYKVENANDKPDGPDGSSFILHGRRFSFNGIVYSEMKKGYSNPVERAHEHIYSTLHANNYKYDSGGDPEAIVELGYDELVKFYEQHYNTKNATLYFYGPGDVIKQLDFIGKYLKENKNYVAIYPPIDTSHTAGEKGRAPQTYVGEHKVIRDVFGSSNIDHEGVLYIAWLLNPKTDDSRFKIDLVDIIGLNVLEHLLVGTPESLLHKALIQSKLGKSLVSSGLSTTFEQATFMVGLDGVTDQEDREKLVQEFNTVVLSTLESKLAEGFKRDAILASYNHTEFQLRELNTGSFPRGLEIINLVQGQLQYGKDPLAALYFDTLLKRLHDRVFGGDGEKDPQEYFKTLVERYFLKNYHRVTVDMQAIDQKDFEKRSNEKVAQQLKQQLGHLTREEVDRRQREYDTFKARMDAEDDPNLVKSFPKLGLEDIDRETEVIPTDHIVLGGAENGVHIYVHPLESQGIVYLDLAISLDYLSLKELEYLDLYTTMLREAGTRDKTAESMSYHISQNLGDLSVSFSFMAPANGEHYADPDRAKGFVFVRAKALQHKLNELVSIPLEVISNCNFSNRSKGLEILERKVSQIKNAFVSEGHRYASRRMRSRFAVADHAAELTDGFSYYEKLKNEIIPLAQKDWTAVEKILLGISEKIRQVQGLKVNVSGTGSVVHPWLDRQAKTLQQQILQAFPSSPKDNGEVNWVTEILAKDYKGSAKELIVTSTAVNFVGIGGSLFTKDDVIDGSNDMVLHFLKNGWLWKQVRDVIGAYGVFANLTTTGNVIFMSYADPNFQQTLDAFKGVVSALEDALQKLEEDELLRQKIGTISNLDRPLLVDAKGFLAFSRILREETEEIRQKFRQDIINATKSCLSRLLERFQSQRCWENQCAVVGQATAESLDNYTKLEP